MQIHDSITLDASGLTFTKDGYLIGDAKVSRAGNVQQYYGKELGLTGEDEDKVFGVYRDPDAVFDRNSMMSLAGRPVTRGHPESGVTADNWKELSIGQVGGVISKDGDHVVAPMAIMDAAASKEVSSGARSLSAGYTTDLIQDEGTVDGVPYQFKQSNIKFNHVAYLPENNPRAGNTRMGDANHPGVTPTKPKEGKTMTDNLKTVLVDGLSVQTTDAGAQAIEKLQKELTDAQAKVSDAEKAKQEAIAAKDKEIATKDAKIDELEKAKLSDADLDAKVNERADLIGVAKSIADQDYSGKSVEDIRKLAVTAKLGDEAVKDKSNDYVAARFDILAEDAQKDPVRRTLQSGTPAPTHDAESSYKGYVTDLQDAWKQKKASGGEA